VACNWWPAKKCYAEYMLYTASEVITCPKHAFLCDVVCLRVVVVVYMSTRIRLKAADMFSQTFNYLCFMRWKTRANL